MPKLKYTGGGYNGALPGIPGRDLTAEEVEQHGGADALIATGLYEPVTGTSRRSGRVGETEPETEGGS